MGSDGGLANHIIFARGDDDHLKSKLETGKLLKFGGRHCRRLCFAADY